MAGTTFARLASLRARLALPPELLATRRRQLLVGTLGTLVVLLLATLTLGARFLLLSPGAQASVLPPLTMPGQPPMPRFVFSIDGVAQPFGVAASSSGDRIYVPETTGERKLKIFDRDGNLLRAVAPPDTVPAGRVPVYVAVHPSTGKVYVSDRTRATIDVYSRDGDYEGEFAPPEEVGRPWAPLAVAFAPSGDMAVSDLREGQHRVLIFGEDGTLRLTLGPGAPTETAFSYPNAVAFDAAGHIFVADSNNGRVDGFDSEGRLRWVLDQGAGFALGLPRGMAIAGGNRLYVVDTVNHHVLTFALGAERPQYLFTLGQPGAGAGEFSFPNGLAVDETGRVYITDREANRVQVWQN